MIFEIEISQKAESATSLMFDLGFVLFMDEDVDEEAVMVH